MIKEIENLREKLNEMVEKQTCDSMEVLELSRKMDILILNYLEQKLQRSTVRV